MQCLSRSYEAGIWDVLSKLRNQTSKSRRLASEKAYKSLVALYDRITELDGRLDRIVRQTLPPKERAEALAPIRSSAALVYDAVSRRRARPAGS